MSFRWKRSAATCTLLLALACSERQPATGAPTTESPYSAYLGRYRIDEAIVVAVRDRDGLPIFLNRLWGGPTVLEPVAGDGFRALRSPGVKFLFHRNTDGLVSELEVLDDEKTFFKASRLSPTERLPIEALLDGQPDEALQMLEGAEEVTPDRALGLVHQLLSNSPSRATAAAAFLDGVAERFPTSADVQEARGVAWVSAGDRDKALTAFRCAVELDEDNQSARVSLGRLDSDLAPPEAEGWRTPFALADLFSAPTAEEIRLIRQDWRGRDLSPKQVRVVEKSTLKTGHGAFQQRLVSHLVHGELHHAAVLVPVDAAPGCCPVILDVKGISWDYSSRSVNPGLGTLLILRDEATRFIVAVPGLRGEEFEMGGDVYLSEGDRTNGWEGAADDTIALLSAVLETVPEADPERVGVFGNSRGASVAMLAAARDPRFDCVVAWAGPSDWFRLVGSWGWTLEELVRDGLRYQWQPGQGNGSAGQFIEWFLRGPIDLGRPSLAEVRERVAASSPLYFADTLPPSDLHYGVEDGSVVVANGLALRDRLVELGRSAPDYLVTLHEGTGHAMPYPWAYDQSRDFLLRHLIETPEKCQAQRY